MSEVKLFHNSRCSKSGEALAYLKEQNINFTVIEYLKEPLSIVEIKDLAQKLDKTPAEFIRKKETIFKDQGLNNKTDDELIMAIAKNPILLERPILIIKDKAVIGRPLDNIVNLISKYY